jgi:hypothetical protein
MLQLDRVKECIQKKDGGDVDVVVDDDDDDNDND